jgi:hypothetical protein
MSDAKVGARLILPLTKLEPSPAPPKAPAPNGAGPAGKPTPTATTLPTVPRTLDLDADRHDVAKEAWHAAVRSSAEACLLLDDQGRVCAASLPAAQVLGGISGAIGAKFADLVSAVDFTSGAAPDLEPERSMPPLRSLATGGLARGLMRVRVGDGSLVTYDVVAVPLERQCAVLAFFVAV